MWVLVVFKTESDEVEVRGPWNTPDEANGAAKAYAKRLSDDERVLMTVTLVTPMVYFNPQ